MDTNFLYIIMSGFGLGFICWILGATFGFIVSAASSPQNMRF